MKNLNQEITKALSFTPRLSAPTKTNKYYYSNINPFYAAGLGLPNCTAYAYGRTYELTNKKPTLSTSNAKEWFNYNKNNGFYKYGQTPKLGAVACWGAYGNYTYGHVAVVEKITNTQVTVSESQYTAKVIFTTHTFNKGDMTYSWNKNFLGFIYPADFGDSSTGGGDSSTVIATGTATENLNLRTSPSTSASIIITIPKGSKVDILEKLTGWYKVKYNGKVGYVSSDYVTLDSSSGGGTTGSANPLAYPRPTRAIEYTTPIMMGEDVKYVQAGLKRLGYSISIDGNFGLSSKNTTIQFQKDNRLNAEGYFGSLSLSKMRTLIGDPYLYPVPTRAIEFTAPVMTGEDVKFIQAGLKYLGYSINVDGSYGSGTRDIVIKFQKDNGLNAEGYFGSLSVSKMQQCLKK